MPANAFNVGRDVSLTIFTSTGIIGTAGLSSFTSAPMTAEIKDVRLNGRMYPAYLPEGWGGSFEFTRIDSSLDDYFASMEDGYYGGQDLPSATITETITELNGSITQYRYTDVAIKFGDAGNKAGNTAIKQKVDFMAGRRRKVI